MKRLLPLLLALIPFVSVHAQEAISRLEAPAAPKPAATPDAPPAPKVASLAPATAAVPAPTWDTQKQARAYVLGIPGPRGQIVDRRGNPLAQTRVSFNLGIRFPTPLTMTDTEVLAFTQQQVLTARTAVGRPITLTRDQVLKHYKNRGVLPMLVAQDLKSSEIESFNRLKPEHLTLQAVYQRVYPQGQLAGHILGYAGRAGRMPDGPIQNNELLWPDAVGREGLEQSFDDQLHGKNGQYDISFDPSGKKSSEKITANPQPGYNIVTTIDTDLQRLCENTLKAGVKRGAMVIIDPNNGDILAMASWPTINPNWFIPTISEEAFNAINNDKNIPLIPRAYRSAYPPGSVFKVPVALAALQERVIDIDDEFNCPPSLTIGRTVFRNWRKSGAGSLNFCDALTQSCDTWYYQVGIKTGAKRMSDWSKKLGLGERTGIPLAAESGGVIPDDAYFLKVHGHKMFDGDLANMSIGQGDVQVTPLQMAQAMAAVGNGGTLYRSRLVQQVQSIDGQIVNAYPVRARGDLGIDARIMKEIRKAMSAVVSSRAGTGGKASVSGVQVAGKTGTAQWGPKKKEKTAAWFAGFAPTDKPRYAFAVVSESDVGNADDFHGGTSAAPLIGRVLRQVFANEAKAEKADKADKDEKADKKKKGKKDEPEEPEEPVQDSGRD
ncbi:MAG: penicillin-binding protein 2 [Chthoniobacter sp.]|nr:penicillin-binding protein 2 [Chthoniobacter sp.]